MKLPKSRDSFLDTLPKEAKRDSRVIFYDAWTNLLIKYVMISRQYIPSLVARRLSALARNILDHNLKLLRVIG